ncbi:MAG: DUF4193 domain-containing protein [Acidimicrobiia bacterium]|nr:DUF4193 domain-containing protein [Acidimicrobiia bacterium]
MARKKSAAKAPAPEAGLEAATKIEDDAADLDDVDEVDDVDELDENVDDVDAIDSDSDDDDDDDENDDATDGEQTEALEELEAEELEMLTEDEASETLIVDEAAQLRAIRREELAMSEEGPAGAGEGEFTCSSCFLVKRSSQLANKRKKVCSDCAA